MARSKAFILLHKMTIQIRVVLVHVILNLLAEVTYNKNEIFNTRFTQLVNEPAMQGEIRVTVIATGFDRQIEGGLTAAAARTSSHVAGSVVRTVIPINQRNPVRPTVQPRTIVPLADGAPRRVIPPSAPTQRAEPELTDMDIPTFIRRQMD